MIPRAQSAAFKMLSLSMASLLLMATASAANVRPARFSAGMVLKSTDDEPSQVWKLYVQDDKMRLDIPQSPTLPGQGHYAAVAMWSADRRFHYAPTTKGDIDEDSVSTAVTPLEIMSFHPQNPANLCTEFQQYIESSKTPLRTAINLKCQRIGAENVAGVPAEIWQLAFENGRGSSAGLLLWISPEIRFIVRFSLGGVIVELQGLKEGPQSPALFEIASDAKDLN